MENGVDSLYTKPREWAEWIIGTFDPTFKKQPYFFKGWEEDVDAISALLVFQQDGYDKARRFAADEIESEMMLVQACVGPDVFVYKMPYLPAKPRLELPESLVKPKPTGTSYDPPKVLGVQDYIDRLEEPAMLFFAFAAAMLILALLGI